MDQVVAVLQGLRRAAKRVLGHAVEWRVPRIEPQIVRRVPHDASAFTQGFAWSRYGLFESLGRAGRSELRQICPETGTVLKRVRTDEEFLEGIAIRGDRLVQLTLDGGRAFVYELPTLRRIGEVRYAGEGWGLACDGDRFLMSDGSSVVQIRDAAFRPVGRLTVRSHRIPVRHLNDLEWARGRVYANLWYRDTILRFVPETGEIDLVVDCARLVRDEAPDNPHNILNGIGYDADSGHFCISGKLWKTLYIVKM